MYALFLLAIITEHYSIGYISVHFISGRGLLQYQASKVREVVQIREVQEQEQERMGNCMWARMGSEGQMWKVVAGMGADAGTLKTKTKNKTCGPRHGGAVEAQKATTRLDEVDVSAGVELQVGDGLGPATAPCRLSSGTAADLFARIAFANGAHTTTTTTTTTTTATATATAAAAAAAVSVPSVEVLPSAQKGVWKVRLVITAEQLAEILSHQSNTEALIQRMSLTAAAQEHNKDQNQNQNQNQQTLQQLKPKAKIKAKAKAKTKTKTKARVLCSFPDSDPGTPELQQQQQQEKKKMEDTHHDHGCVCLNRTTTCPWRPSLDSISELPLEDTASHCEADDGPDFDHDSGVNGDCSADSSSCAGGVTVKTMPKFLEIDLGQDNNKNK